MTDRNSPIGIFDSGVGGLTVFREVARNLPSENLIYLGDSARVPYGTKSPATVERYTREAADFLLARNIKMLVVACNTATAAALPILRSTLKVPVIGVVDPGAEAAVAATRGRIGVIATEGTVRSKAYTKAIHAIAPDVEVIESACPLFVPLVEEGWSNTRVAREVAEVYLAPLLDSGIDTLVLGCTHYPLLRNTIELVVGDKVTIVDSAETTARKVAEGSVSFRGGNKPGEHLFLVTDAAERFERIAGEFLEQTVRNLQLVSFGP